MSPRKTKLKEFTIKNGPKFLVGNYRPRQPMEVLIDSGMKHLSSYTYYPEVIVGEKMNGRVHRVDGVIPELKELISIRCQAVSGSADDKLMTEVQCLQDACDQYGWKHATLVISDPNDKMNWGKAFLSKNKFSRSYARNQERFPNVEIVEFEDFADKFYDQVNA
jgi:hypothetical protein